MQPAIRGKRFQRPRNRRRSAQMAEAGFAGGKKADVGAGQIGLHRKARDNSDKTV
jgi:hypothetical protein